MRTMSEWKLYGKCETCPRKTFFIRKRDIRLPIGSMAKSQKLMCGQCIDRVRRMLGTNSVTTVDNGKQTDNN